MHASGAFKLGGFESHGLRQDDLVGPSRGYLLTPVAKPQTHRVQTYMNTRIGMALQHQNPEAPEHANPETQSGLRLC